MFMNTQDLVRTHCAETRCNSGAQNNNQISYQNKRSYLETQNHIRDGGPVQSEQL